MAGKYMKGALVSFTQSFIGAVPNVIIFQFNPETITHTWSAASGGAPSDPVAGRNPQASKGIPGETFGFTLAMDANDMIADGNVVSATLAGISGVYTRLAALEMLQYPLNGSGPSLTGSVSASISASGVNVSASLGLSSSQQTVPRLEVPTVLFIWGPQRIVPVRLTGLTINEKIYDANLNPTHAEAQVTLRVLTPDELIAVSEPMKSVANIAYSYTIALRQVQALANLGDSAASIIGMLPTPF